MFQTSDYFVLILLVFVLVERFFAYRISLSFRRDVDALQSRMGEMLSEFVKLATMLQADLLHRGYKDSSDKNSFDIERKSELKSTDTQFLVTRREIERLREIEKSFLQDHTEQLLKKRESEKKDDDDDWRELIT